MQPFEEYYSNLFGPRWRALKQTMYSQGPKINLKHLYSKLQQDYWLDPASHFITQILADALRNNPTDTAIEALQVWDMCAAPGGKLLALSQSLDANVDDLCIVASEVSQARFARLQQQSTGFPQWQLRRANACQLAQSYKAQQPYPRLFQAILLDAPCSSERHILQQSQTKPKVMQEWNGSRSKRNGQTQLALLCSALDCIALGGHILYATCALSPLENAQVVAKALKKRRHLNIVAVAIAPENYGNWVLEPQYSEQIPLGYSLLPDYNNGSGPLYFCLLQRN